FIGGDAVGVGHVAALYGRHVEAGDGVVADLGAVATGVDSAHVAVRHVGVQAGDRIADDVGAGEDSPSVGFAGRAACVVGRVAAHPAVVASVDQDRDFQIVVQAVVLHQVTGAAVQVDALPESPDIAVAHGGVLLAIGTDAVGLRAVARRQPADLEAVAVDGDVVGGNGDGIAGGDVGGQVLVQAPDALGVDGGGQRADVIDAGIVAFRRTGGRRDGQQAAEQQQGGQQAVGGGGHGLAPWNEGQGPIRLPAAGGGTRATRRRRCPATIHGTPQSPVSLMESAGIPIYKRK